MTLGGPNGLLGELRRTAWHRMNSELSRRLADTEDQFTERKPEGAGSNAFKKAIVAFANTVPPNRTGVLFVGVGDDVRQD